YKLDTVVIPTNRPISRDDREDKVYKTVREKFNAVVDEIVELTELGRPVLVGTTSVEISELLSRMLHLKKIEHQVLNAKQHAREADVVAAAGQPGTVTIATNMAGRGTDIKLAAASKKAGGLAIIGTERHESRRVDRQLRGRAGRQGDNGSSQFFVSLEDNLMRLFGSDRVAKLMDRMGLKEGEMIQHSMISKSIERAQRKVEENNFGIRKRLLEYDDIMNQQRTVIYERRKNALMGERLKLDIMNMLYDTCEDILNETKTADDFDSFKLNSISVLGIDTKINREYFTTTDMNTLVNDLYDEAFLRYNDKNTAIASRALPLMQHIKKERGATVENILLPITDGKRQIGVAVNLEKAVETENAELIKAMEKSITLGVIDLTWKEHLRDMDDLKQSVQNAVYEQKDPLLIYKFEAFQLFKAFLSKVNEDTVSFLSRADIPQQAPDRVQEARSRGQQQKLNESKEESRSALTGQQDTRNRPPVEKIAPIKSDKIFGRNDKVNVQYQDGTVKKDVKFKQVEEDILAKKCVLLDE
ncbi:MAG: preprotein translocase subunit SecA, partial [Roseivirga sp.]